MSNLNSIYEKSELDLIDRAEIHRFLEELATGAAAAQRTPVKTFFSNRERQVLADYFKRTKRGKRGESLVAICGLLGDTLTTANCDSLFLANIVQDLHFLVGKDKLRLDRSTTDWTNKYFGTGKTSDGFVVGLTRYFYDYVSVEDLLPPDTP